MQLPQIERAIDKASLCGSKRIKLIITNKNIYHFIEKGEGNKLIKNVEMIIL